jgi:hypothetical protein
MLQLKLTELNDTAYWLFFDKYIEKTHNTKTLHRTPSLQDMGIW